MKNRSKLLMALLMAFCMMLPAMAEGSTALVRAGASGKVNLRKEPSAQSASMGLYYTGAEAECLSSTADGWVRVRIGTETGWMKERFLYRGNDAIENAKPNGYVNAVSGLNMRTAPNAKAAIVRTLPMGEGVTIQGETAGHWCYVQAGSDFGYVYAAYLSGEPEQRAVSVEFAVERFLNQAMGYSYFPDREGSEYARNVMFFINEPVTDFRYCAITCDVEADGRLICTGCVPMYTEKALPEGGMCVAAMEFPELIPDRAVAFTDAAGRRQLWGVLLGGADDLPMLIPIEGTAKGVQP